MYFIAGKIEISAGVSANVNNDSQQPLKDDVYAENETGYSQRPGHADVGVFGQHGRVNQEKYQQNKGGEKIEIPQGSDNDLVITVIAQ